MRSPNRERDVVCLCGTAFKARHSQSRYCSESCARAGARKSWRDYGQRNRPTRQAYQRERYRTKRDAITERIKRYRRTPSGQAVQRRHDERQRAKFPEKYAARQAVLVAVRAGKLTRRPCRCGATKVQAHHHDYSKPLDVVWLCSRCHAIEEGRAVIVDVQQTAVNA